MARHPLQRSDLNAKNVDKSSSTSRVLGLTHRHRMKEMPTYCYADICLLFLVTILFAAKL